MRFFDRIKILTGCALVLWRGELWAQPTDGLAPGEPARETTRYALTSTTQAETHDPTAWRLLASNNGGNTWVTLDVRTNEQFTGRSQQRTFYIRNRRPYNTYRLQIDAVNSTNVSIDMTVQLGGVSLIGPLVNVGNESELTPIVSSSSSNPVIGPPEYAFDADPTTVWTDAGFGSPGGCWLQIQYATHSGVAVTNLSQAGRLMHLFAAHALLADGGARALSNLTAMASPPRKLSGYALTSANDEPERDPRDWEILGSDDGGKSWTKLDTRVNQIFTERFERRVFPIANAAPHRLYRLRITACATTNTDCQIAEIEPIYGDPENDGRYSLVVEASGENPPLESTEMAFDGDARSKWLSFSSADPNEPCWAQWQLIPREEDFPVINQRQLDRLAKRLLTAKLLAETNIPTVTVDGYALTSANDFPARDPRDWKLQGSADGGKTWQTLDERQNETFPQRFQRRVFKLEHPAAAQVFRLQILSVAAPTNANSVQLGKLELLLAHPGQGKELTALVSAAGENPPAEAVDNLFDGDAKTKWLDYSTGSSNHPSWVQWHYVLEGGHGAIDLDREQVAQSLSPKRLRAELSATVLFTNAARGLAGLGDGSGFQWLHLDPWPAQLAPGWEIQLNGNLQIKGGALFVSEARVKALTRLPSEQEAAEMETPSTEQFFSGRIIGRVTGVFSSAEYSGATLALPNGTSLAARLPGERFPVLPGVGCPVAVDGIVEYLIGRNGMPAPGVVWAASPEAISLAPQNDEDWNKLSELAPTLALPAAARLRGTVEETGQSDLMILRAGTNRVPVAGPRVGSLAKGETAEVAGILSREGGTLSLRQACARPAGAPSGMPDGSALPQLLTCIADVNQYINSGAPADAPVEIRGVVTYIDLNLGEFYMQDGRNSAQVIGQMNAGLAPKLSEEGSYIELRGVVHEGNLYATTFARVLGKGRLPEPARPSWDHLLSGEEDNGWVEVEGVVTAADRQRLTVSVSGGQLIAWINELDRAAAASLPGSVARIRGVCSPVVNARNQRLGVRLLVPSFDCVDLVSLAPENPFALRLVPMEEIMRADNGAVTMARQSVRTKGVVTCRQGRMLFLQDKREGMRVTLREAANFTPGEVVEAVGLPQPDGFSPKLIQAVARKVGNAVLPAAPPIDLLDTTSEDSVQERDATRASMEGIVLNETMDASHWTLSLRNEKLQRVFSVYLPAEAWRPGDSVPVGSKISVQGVFKAISDRTPDVGQAATSFEMFLNSARDITVLARPSWWTSEHALQVGAVFVGILVVALAWIGLLRKQVRQRTQALALKIEEHQRSEALLAAEVAQRKRLQADAEKAHKELLVVARQAGMAEVATGILHNVGNVLNSVSVSSSLMIDRLRRSRVKGLENAVVLMRQRESELGPFFTADPKGQKLLPYLEQLATHLVADQAGGLQELEGLDKNIEHIKDIVTVQQNSAKFAGLIEPLIVTELVEDALRMNASSLERHGVEVKRDIEAGLPMAFADRHKVLQILVNLVRNAKQACDASNALDRAITISARNGGATVKIAISDTGVGIAPENMNRVFNHGFTTRKDGHGFGLHNAALFAKEMGGCLRVASDGPGLGATFTLELPIAAPERAATASAQREGAKGN